MDTDQPDATAGGRQGTPGVDSTGGVLLAAALRDHLQLHRQMGITHYPLTPSLRAFLRPQPQLPVLPSRSAKQAADRHRQAFPPPVAPPAILADRFSDLHRDISSCSQCSLASARNGQVLGLGKAVSGLCVVGDYCRHAADMDGVADLLFGIEEDALLWKMLQAIGLDRETVYVTNVCKCIPSAEQTEERVWAQSCQGFVDREIALVQPRLILAMGEVAARAVLGGERSVLRLRGKLHPSRFAHVGGGNIPVMVSLHPRYLLAQPAMKKAAWHDLQMVQRQLQIPPKGENA